MVATRGRVNNILGGGEGEIGSKKEERIQSESRIIRERKYE